MMVLYSHLDLFLNDLYFLYFSHDHNYSSNSLQNIGDFKKAYFQALYIPVFEMTGYLV